jgi:hypothetical protein
MASAPRRSRRPAVNRFAPEGRAPRAGVNVREVIGVPELKPRDLRHGVAVEMYGEHGDLEKARALRGHQRIDTTGY